jgi:acetyltransferase-like isoleucine patch superfamily enzyme
MIAPRPNLLRLAMLATTSGACTLALRARGVQCDFVSCDGHLPSIYARGRVRLGRVALRGRLVPVELGALAGAVLEIGDGTFINQGASIVANERIVIGKNVRIGDFVAIYDTDHHPVDELTPTQMAPVTVGDDVWIGRGAILLPGSSIGEYAVVAAGAVVSGAVPARTLVAGAPARHLRDLSAASGWRRP